MEDTQGSVKKVDAEQVNGNIREKKCNKTFYFPLFWGEISSSFLLLPISLHETGGVVMLSRVN